MPRSGKSLHRPSNSEFRVDVSTVRCCKSRLNIFENLKYLWKKYEFFRIKLLKIS